MEGPIRIDKSLARGAFRQELRNNPTLFADPQALSGDSLDSWIFLQCLKRGNGWGEFNPSAFKSIARAVSTAKTGPGETIYSVDAQIVPGSVRKSFVETAFRSRPYTSDETLACQDGYVFLRKDRLIGVNRLFPVSVSVHAIQRYIQRGSDVKLTDANVAAVLDETCKRAGLFILLAHVAGRDEGVRFAVPFKEGFLLCEAETAGLPFVWRLDAKGAGRGTKTLALFALPHQLLWLAGRAGPAVYHAKTYVGRGEMKAGQAALHDLLEGVYARTRREIDLLGRLGGSFYPGHDPKLDEALAAAVPKLDQAVRDIAAALSWDNRLSYAFMKEHEYSASAAVLPSAVLAEGAEFAASYRATASLAGVHARRGGIFCHAEGLGLPGFEDAAFVPDESLMADAAPETVALALTR